jgi:hypothetical protein
MEEIRGEFAGGHKRTALHDLARFLKDEPDNLEAWLLLGQNVDDPQQKADCYRRVLELDPDNPLARQGLEWIYSQPGLNIGGAEEKTSRASSPGGQQITEVLEPVNLPPAPTRSRRWLRIGLLIASVLLFAGLGLGIWAGLKNKPSASPSTTVTPLEAPAAASEQAATPAPGGTSAVAGTIPLASETPDPIFLSAGISFFYAIDTELWQWHSGYATRLADTSLAIHDLQVSTDGALAAFQSMDGLWVIPLTSESHAREVANPLMLPADDLPGTGLQRKVHTYTWLPGSHVLVLDTYWVESSGTIRLANDLIAINADSGELQILLTVDEGGMPFTSPDGSRLALVTTTRIQVYDLEGAATIADFLFEESLTPDGTPYQPTPVWSTDSTALVAVIPPGNALNDRTAATGIWRIPADSSQSVQLGVIYPMGGHVLVSPDLERIAYLLGDGAPTQNRGELHMANLDGSADTILQDGKQGIFFGWTPDGSSLVLRLASEPSTLWLVNGRTHATSPLWAKLPSDSSIADLQWLPNGFFLAELIQPHTAQVWIGKADSQVNPYQVVATSGDDAVIPFDK